MNNSINIAKDDISSNICENFASREERKEQLMNSNVR